MEPTVTADIQDDPLDQPISDEELAELALAAAPDPPLDPRAVPFSGGPSAGADGLLPDWYMPTPQRLDRRPAVRVAVTAIVAALLLVNGAGLCVTYGWPEIAW